MKLFKYNCLILIICSLFIIGFVSSNENANDSATESKLNCSTVFCPLIPSQCPKGQALFTEKCCPRCVNCSDYKCPKEIKCETDFHLTKDPKNCCESCVKCNPIGCPRIAIICKKGEHPGVPVNKCCAECVKCTQECPLINCITGSELYYPTNSCCPKCRPIETSKPSQ
ncbi:hypothetical protein DICPUDRAFT_91900 [Dictyostelium purpureum]|uniref:4Fe-4S ferredoxin-type domain-containing protein n=1 Tax=Dictyostelium purpureum TaxID=5786 RepID=F0ZIX4_DICPU|nr:uncharacterized protein DICPUDRAFT_91900 [Dictyostelium purpureum]EGC36117.1 hypothetical protein DICPUDRAFT_91900 [Dictyostelium purpureum]|eukprot:XP_003287374.1 hypothetical protein DICPUDRAFT_91900 [Dictyostelium purpureum]